MSWKTTPVLLLDGPVDWAEGTMLTLPTGWLRHDSTKASRTASLPPGSKREAMARQWAIAARKEAHGAGKGVVAAGPGVSSLASGENVRVFRPGDRVDGTFLHPKTTKLVKPYTPKSAEGWRMLHRFAMWYDGDAKAAEVWLEQFAAGLGCDECRKHWRSLVAENPPDLTDVDSFFAWSVDRHNDVNKKVGHSEVTVEEAREIWREPLQTIQHAGATFEEVILP